MKASNLIFHMTMSAILLMVSCGLVEEYCLCSTNNTPGDSSSVSIGGSPPDSREANQQLARNASAAGIGLSHSVSGSWLAQPIPDDPHIDKQWALRKVQAPQAWLVTRSDGDIRVAILDTGIDRNHEDLDGKVVAEINFTDGPTPSDIHGHGTHIAGIVAATSNNGKGVAGLAPESRLINVKVVDDRGRCRALVLAQGIVWAADNGASVLNISLELRESSVELQKAIEYAWRRGAIIVAAAGNDGGELPTYPAYYENSIAVSATGPDDTPAPLSNHGDWVDVAAPGLNLYSTLPGNSYGYKSGTSFAAAYVSGLAALLLDIAIDTNGNGRLNDEVRAAIEAGCLEIGVDGVGKGRIDAAKAINEMGYAP